MKLLAFCLLLMVFSANGWPFDRNGFVNEENFGNYKIREQTELQTELICKFELTDSTGILTSPNYPSSYSTPVSCTYKIIQPPGYVINMSISDIDFGWNETTKNSNAYLTIIDGDNETFKRVDILYGSDTFIPGRTYQASTNYLFLEFKSYPNCLTHRGFHAVYKSMYVGCGGLLKNNGIIRHPSTGLEYNNNEHCYWLIEAPPDHVVSFDWNAFATETRDFIKITEWNKDNQTLLQFSGTTLPPPIRSTGRRVNLYFDSDYSVVNTGFEVTYTFVNVKN